MLRYCKCGEKVLVIASPKGSFIEDHPEYIQRRKKGEHKKK